MSLTPSSERRLSLNGRNAYIMMTSTSDTTTTPMSDDSSYLTAKPLSRASSLSPQLLARALSENSTTTVSDGTKNDISDGKSLTGTIPKIINQTGTIPKIINQTGTIPKIQLILPTIRVKSRT